MNVIFFVKMLLGRLCSTCEYLIFVLSNETRRDVLKLMSQWDQYIIPILSEVLWSDAIVLRMDVDVPSKEKVGKTVRARQCVAMAMRFVRSDGEEEV